MHLRNIQAVFLIALAAACASPSGAAVCYNSNAESFLEIDEAMGRTMLEFSKTTKTIK